VLAEVDRASKRRRSHSGSQRRARPGCWSGRRGAASAPACRGRRETPRFRPIHKPARGRRRLLSTRCAACWRQRPGGSSKQTADSATTARFRRERKPLRPTPDLIGPPLVREWGSVRELVPGSDRASCVWRNSGRLPVVGESAAGPQPDPPPRPADALKAGPVVSDPEVSGDRSQVKRARRRVRECFERRDQTVNKHRIVRHEREFAPRPRRAPGARGLPSGQRNRRPRPRRAPGPATN
jgi:hypothetical protein